MKLLTFTVPCYNSAAYMNRCIDSLLMSGDDIEIIIINDGSADDTGRIADQYQTRHPGIIRVIHQANGGYGEGVNQGLRNTAGLYFKVVDSDDWVDAGAVRLLLDQIRAFMSRDQKPELILSNYVYEHMDSGENRMVRFRRVLPRNRMFTWADIGTFGISRFLLMHAMFYRTDFLRNTAPELPHHTFYVDNILAYQPLPQVRSLYYMDIAVYHYCIGRAGQTIDEAVLIRSIDQHSRVIRILIDTIDFDAVEETQPRLARYLRHGLSMMMYVSTLMLMIKNTPESLQKKKALWEYLRLKNIRLFRRFRYSPLCIFLFLPGKTGRKACVSLYHCSRKLLILAVKSARNCRRIRGSFLRALTRSAENK